MNTWMVSGPADAPAGCAKCFSPLLAANPEEALDMAVKEIFEQMLGVDCTVHDAGAQLRPVSAIIGLAGKISGSCTLSAGPAAVMAISHHLQGIPLPPADEMAQNGAALDDIMLDAFGELGNMIAGGWKGRLPGLDSECSLSVPSIVYGSNYELHAGGRVLLVERSYRFEEFHLHVVIRGEVDNRPL